MFSNVFNHTEPVGSVKPKFTTVAKSLTFETRQMESMTVLCPAQGYPVPLFRLVSKFLILCISIYYSLKFLSIYKHVLVCIHFLLRSKNNYFLDCVLFFY